MARTKKDAGDAGMTMEQAAAADAERQAGETLQMTEAEADAKFRAHLAGLGGPQMVGDLTQGMLEIVDQLMKRHGGMKKGWKGLGEFDQKDLISRVEWAAKELVAGAVSGVAANRFASLPAILDTLNIKDGYKVVLKAPINPDVLPKLGASQGKQVVLVLADPEVFARHDPIKPMKDQPALPGVPEPAAQPGEQTEPGNVGGDSPLAGAVH
jgi:hypothetical protein